MKQPAGEFSEWLGATLAAQSRRTAGADVPCGACTVCCRSSFFIHIRPEETETLRVIPKSLLFTAPGLPKGHVLMGYNEQGHCPMFKGGRCSIYEQRPQTCRDFDCRVFAAAGMEPEGPTQASLAARVREWRFALAADDSRRALDAVRAAGAFLREHADLFPTDALPRSPGRLASLALRAYRLFLPDHGPDGSRSDAEIARAILAELVAWEKTS